MPKIIQLDRHVADLIAAGESSSALPPPSRSWSKIPLTRAQKILQ